jgi:HSP20 family protein
MMNLVRFEPWSISDLMQRDFDRRDVATPAVDWVPAVDIVELKDGFLLRADVPGVVAEDIEVSMEEGLLTVSGERAADAHDETDGVRRFERKTGRFCRRFSLPDSADAEGIAAKCANGILEVSIPKMPEVQPRRITVQAA